MSQNYAKMIPPSSLNQGNVFMEQVPNIQSNNYTLTGLINLDNYYRFTDMVLKPDEPFTIYTRDITLDNYEEWFQGIFNIMVDGIRSTLVTDKPITIDFSDINQPPLSIEMYAVDVLFNIIFWYICVRTDQKIKPKHIIWEDRYMTQNHIKEFFDNFAIENNRKKYSNMEINNIIDTCIRRFGQCDMFSSYCMQTINLKDNLDLMKASPEFNDLMHSDLSGVPIEDINNVGMDITNRAIEIILNSRDIMGYEHCLANFFRSGEGINKRQYKEFSFSNGTKPDGNGGVFPTPINTSFLNGGLKDPLHYFIDSHAGRTSQILSKINVGDSGNFARILALNNSDSYLFNNPNYACNTKNFQRLDIKNDSILKLLHGRYARLNPRGMEFRITKDSKDLIGKTIFLRSPMTCESAANGDGICYRCYGDLAYTNHIFNIGRIASDTLSSRLTQRLLSAKHLLETVINKILWTERFENYFDVEYNAIKVSSGNDLKGVFIEIDPETIDSESNYLSSYDEDEEDPTKYLRSEFNEFITSFNLIIKDKEVINMHTLPHSDNGEAGGFDRLYITNELNGVIRKKAANLEGKIRIPLSAFEDEYIFFIMIHNNELSKTMQEIMDLINKSDVTKSYDRESILQRFLETVIKGNLYISSVHCELILSNQLRSTEDILMKPDWGQTDAPYKLITLNDALTNNPSIIVTLMYQKIAKTLYNPLTFRKRGVSFLDLFFMAQPAKMIEGDSVVEGLNPKKEPIIRDKYGFTVLETKVEEGVEPIED